MVHGLVSTLVFWYVDVALPIPAVPQKLLPFLRAPATWHRPRRPGVLSLLAQGQRICVLPGTTARTMISEVSDSVFVGWNHIVFLYVLSLIMSIMFCLIRHVHIYIYVSLETHVYIYIYINWKPGFTHTRKRTWNHRK